MNAGRRFTIRILAILLLGLIACGLQAKGQASAGIGSGLWVFNAYPGGPGYTSPHAAGPNPLFYWAALEPQEGVYNWTPLDQALAATGSSGKLATPRIYTNVEGWGQATPSWVFDAGAAWYYNSVFSRDKGMKQPVPTDPVFTEKFGAFLSALGARYDGDPHIEFFQTNVGMGGYGEMVWGWPDEFKPPGWTPEQNLATVQYWIDRWLEAFPNTRLAFMINAIGWNIATDSSSYAVARGFYLQQNSARDQWEIMDIFRTMQDKTKIVLELEASPRTGDGFDALMDDVFGRGFAIDHLILDRTSFNDPATAAKLPAVQDRLRSAYDPLVCDDPFDVPVPANPDPTPNGVRNHAVTINDVTAELFYLGTWQTCPAGTTCGEASPPNSPACCADNPNPNGVDYDIDKEGDTVADGQDYDRSAGPEPNPPWDAGPPDGTINMQDVLAMVAQVGLDCREEP